MQNCFLFENPWSLSAVLEQRVCMMFCFKIYGFGNQAIWAHICDQWPPRLSCLSIGEIIEESVWASGAIWWSERFLNTHPATFDWHLDGSWTLLAKFQRTNRMHGQTYDLKQYMFGTGWQNLAAFRRGQKWPWKFSSSAYLQFSRQMRRFCA